MGANNLKNAREGDTRVSLARIFLLFAPIYFLAPATQAIRSKNLWSRITLHRACTYVFG